MYIILDIARGIAAMSVFLFHFRDALGQSLPLLAQLAKYGSLGVALFFVVSGYVITASAEGTRKGSSSPIRFLKRRFLRIYPPFWASIVVVLATPFALAALSFLKSGEFVNPAQPALALGAIDWLGIVTLASAFNAPDGDIQAQFSVVNSVYWTLAIEFQFYLCVFVALLLGKFFRAAIASVTIASLLLMVFPLPLNTGLFIHFWPMFATGIAVYYLHDSGIRLERIASKWAHPLSAILVGGMLTSLGMLAYSDQLGMQMKAYFPSAPLGFAVLTAIALWLSEPWDKTLQHYKHAGHPVLAIAIKATAFLGVISYSTYLLHAKVLEAPAMVARQLFAPSNPAYPAFVIGGTLAICSIFYFLVERPCMSTSQKKIASAVLD